MCLILLYCSIRYIPNIRYYIIYWCCIISLLVLSVWGYLQHIDMLSSPNPFFPVTGPFCHPAYYGLTISVYLCIIFHVFIFHLRNKHRRRIHHIIEFICIVIGIPVLVYSESRTACFALVVSMILPYIMQSMRRYSKKWKAVILLISTLFFMILLVVLYSLKSTSAYGRLLIWKVSYEMIKDKPLTGHGKDGFQAKYLYYQANYLSSKGTEKDKYVAGSTHVAFNEPIRITVEYGILGLVMYIIFILTLLRVRSRKILCVVVAKNVLLIIFIQGLFSYPNIVFPIMLLGTIALAVLSRSVCYSQKNIYIPHKYICTVCFISVIFLYSLTYKKFIIYHDLYYDLQNVNKVKNYSNFNQYLSCLSEDNIFIMLYLNLMTRENKCSEQLKYIFILEEKYPSPFLMILKGDIFRKELLFNEAESAYKLAANMVPSSQRARGKLVFLYKEMGKYKEAYQLARDLLTEEVKNYGFDTYELHKKLKEEYPDIR